MKCNRSKDVGSRSTNKDGMVRSVEQIDERNDYIERLRVDKRLKSDGEDLEQSTQRNGDYEKESMSHRNLSQPAKVSGEARW